MRKTLCGLGIFLVFFLGIFSVAVQAAADPSIQLLINGSKVKPEVPLQLVNGRTLVPVYTIQEGLGIKVSWDGKNRKVTVVDGSKKIELTIGSKTARVNGTQKKLDVAPVIIGNRTFLPFRAIGELLGAEVDWENKTRSVILNKTVTPPPPKKPETPQTVKVTSIQQNDQVISIQISGKTEAKSFTMSEPNRIVVDVQNATLATASSAVPGQGTHPAIQNVRFSQFEPDVVRVVVELAGSAKYDLVQSASKVELKLKDIQSPEPSVPPVTNPPVVTEPVEKPPIVAPGNGTTQQPNPTPTTDPLSLKDRVRIVVDAGHGGKDMGATGNNAREKDLTLGIAQRLANNMMADPKLEVIMTRDSELDRQLTERGVKQELSEKVNIANNNNADLFISIHINSSTSASGKGTETYYHNDKSKGYASTIHKHLVQATGFPDRKIKQANFQVIKYTKMPAILIEVGFISNPAEAKEMLTPEFQQRVADAVYAGLKEYIENN
ncbi:N-acetylmuramoyl-L-alanine amidase family protein [Aneurinibacillus aneurinilyticus]|uniref:AMIN domain-containing protein n=2 Tax=Aneurinibacillus aneurinilyticus TaxID=1391 RepID=A0A848D3U1_ANEAE|nr:N-acetylmuramoyl-L-alanine amidase family protein [Aneurinibacillus aneurinilyticus]ERI07523.1 N-acetylmuramoyl-L-alanine amidase [Aneurinibacillus aneurinilyticus ATCC 12856]MED0673005.1 N-acetylmuramoyl-L-alanine amidase family protein [Aneurinibacillus aneurinilyticus]MED0709527.1 N-acetylmuramoyl-L-alanine amidase family protein [Aneurinibacillus aneurinilyticus]MED0726608.1 N-acetylmuramoyl-L-alanine amidase family protein [Aneurinibacillus aneurinilyticus]MED0733732.1 N-acetylmuramoyl